MQKINSNADWDVWRLYHPDGKWVKTTYSVKARTDKEAQSRLRRKFHGAAFSSMSLVAVPHGQTPNAGIHRAAEGRPVE